MIPQNVSTFTSLVYPYRVFIWLDPHTSLINTHLSKARIHTITYTPQKKKKKEEREKNRLHENLPYDEETNQWEQPTNSCSDVNLWPCSLLILREYYPAFYTELFNDPSPVLCSVKVLKLFRTDSTESQSLRIFYMNYLIINKVFLRRFDVFRFTGADFIRPPTIKHGFIF